MLDALRVVARAGASGVDAAGPRAGAALLAWDALRWKAAACNAASADAPDELTWMLSDPDALERLRVADALRFALASVASRGKPVATLATDYLEVHVRYHLGGGTAPQLTQPNMDASPSCPSEWP
jgi:hypothetical protein